MLRSPDAVREYLAEVVSFQAKSSIALPTLAHKFIAQLSSTGQLVRAYSQNIDGLEEKAGLACGFDASAVCIQLHGSIHSLRCSLCLYRPSLGTVAPGSEYLRCEDRARKREDAGKRKCSSGALLPDIRLYNEVHPEGDSIAEAVRYDLEQQPDVLLIMGTSLSVPGVRELVRVMGSAVRASGGRTVLVNRKPPPIAFQGLIDEWVAMDCDEWVKGQLC
ncbi:DHS-like NAD/FAD-binding domain-containing protein [Microdochium trichocladiopsis]|uniref:DHS-like NAD/FAD-binding domain-containing protein n=1 Tax=Microdochium trichocladiopsis TaxID=1682393 RepID=A0A9P9BM32_9PEZI|nr:DHS-like NAD/FAD-binding domain-containing protein [Microdochium trichocladiopsis]KAH7016015.1 DHS-like NAD/FAD-binding domain-containing protein [Microdochium trichocladiopsis]